MDESVDFPVDKTLAHIHGQINVIQTIMTKPENTNWLPMKTLPSFFIFLYFAQQQLQIKNSASGNF